MLGVAKRFHLYHQPMKQVVFLCQVYGRGTEAQSWLSDVSRVHSLEVAWPGLNVDLQG